MDEEGEVVCGATFRVYEEVSMCDLMYLATKDRYQGKKLGTKLMIALKGKYIHIFSKNAIEKCVISSYSCRLECTSILLSPWVHPLL